MLHDTLKVEEDVFSYNNSTLVCIPVTRTQKPGRRVPECPVAFARTVLGIEPDEKQAAVLRNRGHRLILNCTRQWGKSTVTGIRAMHVALSRPETLILVGTPSERQSKEYIRKIGLLAQRAGIRLRRDGVNDISLRFDNGSRIVGLPGRTDDTVRGFSSAGLLIFDEAARVPDELYHGLRPTLAVGNGSLWLMSTPKGRSGFFYHEWTYGTGWERISVPATECPRIPAEFLEEERASKGEELFRQEYLCQFLDCDGSVFDRDLIERAFTAESEPLAPVETARITRPVPRGVHFYIGVDLGQRHDFTAIAVVERIPAPLRHFLDLRSAPEVTFTLRHLERVALGTPYPKVVERVKALTEHAEMQGRCTVVFDATGLGGPVSDSLRGAGMGCDTVGVTISGGEKAHRDAGGWVVPKRDLMTGVSTMLEREDLRIAAGLPERKRLVEEMMALRARRGGSGVTYDSSGRRHDDLVLAVSLACWRAGFGEIGWQEKGRLF